MKSAFTLKQLLHLCTRIQETRNVHGTQLVTAKQNQRHRLKAHESWKSNTILIFILTEQWNEWTTATYSFYKKAQKKNKLNTFWAHRRCYETLKKKQGNGKQNTLDWNDYLGKDRQRYKTDKKLINICKFW